MIAILIPLTIPAQELVLHRYHGQEPDAQFEEILYLAAGVALIQQGLSSSRNAETADYILLASYDIHSSTTDLDYSLYGNTSGDGELASIEVSLPIGPELDDAIAEAIWSLFQAAGIPGDPSADAMIYGLLEGEPNLSDSVPVLRLPAEPSAPEPALRSVSSAGTRPDFSTSASMAGIMFLGEAMQYLRYGVGGKLDFGLSWKQATRSMGLEFPVSFSRAFNNPGVVGGPFYLGTTGFGLSLGTGTDMVYRIGAVIAGGTAFLMVDGTSGILIKTIPYAELGLSIRLPMGPRLFLGGDLRYLAAFDQELVLMGISPAITVGREF
ncbi:MAG: hypothetical protein RBT68_09445 [Spirochaetia bacterium]|nr:hypothetical protein [Spirochaetia bacterium]